jgi:hypothetical protein
MGSENAISCRTILHILANNNISTFNPSERRPGGKLTRCNIKGKGTMATAMNPSMLEAHPIPSEFNMRGAASGSAPPNELRKKVLPANTLAT